MAAQDPEREIALLAAQTARLAEQNRERELDPTVIAAQSRLRELDRAVLVEQNRGRELDRAVLLEQNRARELDRKENGYSNLRSFL